MGFTWDFIEKQQQTKPVSSVLLALSAELLKVKVSAEILPCVAASKGEGEVTSVTIDLFSTLKTFFAKKIRHF